MQLRRINRMMARTAVIAMSLVTTLLFTALPAQAGYVAVNTVAIMQNFAKPASVLGIAGTDPNYGEARQYGVDGYSQWTIQNNPNNGHTIRETNREGRCLDSNFAGQLYGIRCNGGYYQRWHFIYLGRQRASYYEYEYDVYEIRNWVTGLCLDANGSEGYTLACNGGNYQRWFLRPV